MLEFLCYISLIVTIVLFYFAYKKLIANLFTQSFLLLGLGLFYFFDIWRYNILLGNYNALEPEFQYDTIFLFYLSAVFIWFGYFISKKTIKVKPFSAIMNRKIIIYRLRILQVISILIHMTMLGYNKLSDSHYLGLLIFVPAIISIISFLNYQKTNDKIDFFFFITLLILFIGPSSRRIYIVLFSIFLIIYLVQNLQKNIKLSALKQFGLISTIIVIFVFLNFLRSGFFDTGELKKEHINKTIDYIENMKSIDTYYNTGYVIKNFPEHFHYYYGETYLTIILGPLPRSIFPWKPISFSTILGSLFVYNDQRVSVEDWSNTGYYSLSPSFVGEAYANGGIIMSIFLSFILGISANIYERKQYSSYIFNNINILKYIPFYSSFFLLFRGAFYDALVMPLYFLLLTIIIIRFISKKEIFVKKGY